MLLPGSEVEELDPHALDEEVRQVCGGRGQTLAGGHVKSLMTSWKASSIATTRALEPVMTPSAICIGLAWRQGWGWGWVVTTSACGQVSAAQRCAARRGAALRVGACGRVGGGGGRSPASLARALSDGWCPWRRPRR